MTPPESLLARIRGEYREMPGLRLTPMQARRLWQLDGATCEAVLKVLIDEGFLRATSEGAFVAVAAMELSSHLPPARLAMRRGA